MAVTKVLIVISTYPLPSRSYDELVCTAGVLENGDWIRIYPVPFRFLTHRKYEWIEIDLEKHKPSQDFRPESYRPTNPDLQGINILKRIDTRNDWFERKELCLKKVYTNMSRLIEDSKNPTNVSLAAFKPTKILKFIVKPAQREWPEKWLHQLRQIDMFTKGQGETDEQARTPIEKVPYSFQYEFEDDEGRKSTMTIEDWEIGALYRKCVRAADDDEAVAVEQIKEKYSDEFLGKKEITLFLGTTLDHHRKRHSNPFTIIGIFYPPVVLQQALF